MLVKGFYHTLGLTLIRSAEKSRRFCGCNIATLSKHYAKKMYGWIWSKMPLVLNIKASRKWLVSFFIFV